MDIKSYTLSNGVTVTQQKLTLLETFKVFELISTVIFSVLNKFFSGDKINLNDIDIDFFKQNLLNPDNANKFLNIILKSTDKKEIDYLNLPDDNWMDAVEDFFTLNPKLMQKLSALKNKLASLTPSLMSENSEEKSNVTVTSSTLKDEQTQKPSEN